MEKKILVIDDERLVTASLKLLLVSKGYNVTTAADGREGLEKVKETDFDLIVSDVRMPQMDGIETVRQIRSYLKKSNRKLIPEVIITGYADVDKYEMAMAMKVVEYLHKPLDNIEFLEIVRKTIE